MYGELLAVVASFFTALSSVMATKGMRATDSDTANLVLTGSQTAILTVLLLVDVPEVNFWGLVWFALAGICASFVGRALTLKSYKEIGVSVSSAIVGTSPIVVVFFAMLFLGEPFALPILLGSLLVVGGIGLINLKGGRLSINLGALYLPVGASILFAIGNILRKMGTNLLPHSVLGAQFSTLAGLAACVGYMGVRGTLRINVNRDTGYWLVGSGVVNAFAWITLTMAISRGKVSVMSAIIYSYPLFSVILARFMLRDSEELTRNTVLGCVLIVLGVVLVSLLG
jgi:drug/metabolite transporter (DMT)-like permease